MTSELTRGESGRLAAGLIAEIQNRRSAGFLGHPAARMALAGFDPEWLDCFCALAGFEEITDL
jgi:hypothetical protein